MRSRISFQLLLHLFTIININGLSSPIIPFTNYMFSIELFPNMADLWWNIDSNTNEITFELHMYTTGWIALGISPNGDMNGADIGIGWVDSSGQLFFQDRYASGNRKPIIDNTTTDWFGIQGREQDGWTAIQFRRRIDTCDSMDVPIKFGSNILIFAWNDVDPDTTDDIQYHFNRRGSIVVPLLSYSQPPLQDQLAGLDIVEFRASDYTVSTNPSTYYCEVFKVPYEFPNKRHAIAREIVLQSSADDQNLVYHLSLSECNPEAAFDDNNLPRGICDQNATAYSQCTYNIVIGWGKGGDRLVEFPEEAGLPIGLDFSTKYYMLQINYYNGEGVSDNVDASGVRLYVSNELRSYDLGGLTFGVHSLPSSIVIPPRVSSFAIDSYCGADASRSNFPASGLTFFSFFGHTHLQGKSVGTKVIRNGTAVEYLFNAESYNPDYQFQHQLLQPVKVYPDDAFASRCAYQTMDKSDVTLGGRLPTDEMCIQVFNYYPRMDNLYICASTIAPSAWRAYFNISTPISDVVLSQLLRDTNWTSKAASGLQEFYNTASRAVAFGRPGRYSVSFLASLPAYEDLNIDQCTDQENNTTTIEDTTTEVTVVGD